MKHISKLTIWWLILCAWTALAAQDSTPESRTEATPQQSPSQQPRRVVRIPMTPSSDSPQAKVVKRVQPEYPQKAREAHIQGRVVLKVKISREGDVSNVELVSGHPMLVVAAIDAVRQWKYQRYVLNGQPAQRETEAVVDFSLESREGDAAPPPATGVAGDAPGGIPGGVVGCVIAGPVRVSPGVMQGLLATRVNPEYPPEARRGRIQGTVLMHAIITKVGDVVAVELISGHPALAPAAIEAVKQWKYKPFLLNEQPVEVDAKIQVNFTLAGN